MLKRTSLYQEHVNLGGRLIDFGGWELPVQYTSVIDEHEACRNAAGIFDVSHMGEIHITGPESEKFLNYLVTNDVSKIAVGQAQYSAMCNEHGGIVDDLVIYRRAVDRFLVVVNASNTDKDYQHMIAIQNRVAEQINHFQISNQSSAYSQIALQGRHAIKILSQLTQTDLTQIKTYWFAEGEILGVPAILARTGYTGEDGFEIYVAWDQGPAIWRALIEKGQPYGLKPCGLGARDTLRLEMKYPLYGHELTDETLPLEAGLGWVFKSAKGAFVGRDPNEQARQKGLQRNLAGLKLSGRGIPRQGYKLFDANGTLEIGVVTSGTLSPSLKKSIAIIYIDLKYSKVGTQLTVDIRGTKVPAEIISTPFYKRPILM